MSTATSSLDARHAVHVAAVTDYTIPRHEVLATVVLVTAGTDRDLCATVLDALDAQTATAYDVIVVDTGTAWELAPLLKTTRTVRLAVRLKPSSGTALARNIGAHLATGPLLIFLDADAVPTPNFVEAHLRAHRVNNILAARGRVLPRTERIYNAMQPDYDLGPTQFPTYLGLAGNTSFDRDTFLSLGGFDDRDAQPAGHEGVDWTYRALEAGIPREKVIYYPEAITAHDYATDFQSYVHNRRHDRASAVSLGADWPHLGALVAEYDAHRTPDPAHLAFRDRVKLRLINSLAAPLASIAS